MVRNRVLQKNTSNKASGSMSKGPPTEVPRAPRGGALCRGFKKKMGSTAYKRKNTKKCVKRCCAQNGRRPRTEREKGGGFGWSVP